MGTTGLDQQSLDQAVVLTCHHSDSPAPSSGGAWAGTTEVSRPHWAEQMVMFELIRWLRTQLGWSQGIKADVWITSDR
jgi:hypothetical protein